VFGPIKREQIDTVLPAAALIVPSDEDIHAKLTSQEGELVWSEPCQGHGESFRLLDKLLEIEDPGPRESLRLPTESLLQGDPEPGKRSVTGEIHERRHRDDRGTRLRNVRQ
jgi:hypothetical protein